VSPSTLPPVSIFLVWVAFLSLVITGVLLFRWRRPERYSRFQLKLTLILLLFLLVPTVPLVYLAGSAVDQARGLLVALPVDDALEQGLEAVRLSLREEEDVLGRWIEATVAGHAPRSPLPDFTLRYRRNAEGNWQAEAMRLRRPPEGVPADSLGGGLPDPGVDQAGVLGDAFFTGEERVLFHFARQGVFMALLRPPERDYLEAAGVWVAPGIVEARFDLDRGLRMFRQIAGLGGRGFQEMLWTVASLWMVILTVAAFMVSRVLSRGVSGPLLELAKGMERVAGGDLTTQVETIARDEMGVLVASFNTMTDQLREARERIVLAEKQAAWRDVARRIAHEIKNPLTPIQIGIHRIRTRLQNEGLWEADPALQESFKTMNEEVEALRRMAASFSEYAQLPQPAMKPTDLEEVFRAAAALFQQGSSRIHLNVHVKGHIPAVEMDAELVKRVLINLIKNAQESVEEAGGGQVDLRLEPGDGDLLLEVRDNGVGFDPEQAARMFHPDFTTKERGTGLGLSVVARVVADHGWRIEALSEGRGRGAILRLNIPLKQALG
jgi:signal transduction histidine kinase